MLRETKILLALLVGLWGGIGAVTNMLSLDAAATSVRAVTSMSGVAVDARMPWATASGLVVGLGVALIVLGKTAAFVGGVLGARAMTKARRSGGDAFGRAKTPVLVGGGLAVAMLFGGFIVVGEAFFLMFRDPALVEAGSAAFRYGGFIALILIVIAQPEPGA